MILDSKNIKYDVIDITEPGRESDKDFMQNNAKSNGGTVSDPNPRSPLPPQVFNDDEYCGVSPYSMLFLFQACMFPAICVLQTISECDNYAIIIPKH